MLNFTTYCGVPALCESCNRVGVADALETSPHCPDCHGHIRFYNEAELCEAVLAGTQQVFSGRLGGKPHPVSLPDTAYLCPRCRQMHMRLEDVGNWD